MIPVEELHIGCHVEDGLQRRCRVREITQMTVGVNTPNGDWIEIVNDKVYPIEITPELLIEIGFEKHEIHGKTVYRKIYKEIPKLGTMFYALCYNPIAEAWDFQAHPTLSEVKYLHELESIAYFATKQELN